jgi:XisH protein
MARDKYHAVVRVALEKAGWTITDDPFVINVGTTDLQIDLGAERLLAAEQGNERIAVEIKVFGNISLVQAFHTAVGQYMNYRVNLEEYHPERQLFLAVPKSIFETFFASELAIRSVKRLQIKLLIFDPETEVILWQP